MTDVLFICYSRCSTCRKAKDWLESNEIAFTERPIVEKCPTREELQRWQKESGLPLKRFFNTSGLVYKDLNLKEKLSSLSEDEQLRLLASNGMLVKRPLLIAGKRVLVGFKEAEWREAFSKPAV